MTKIWFLFLIFLSTISFAQKNVPLYHVYELDFQGSHYNIIDNPVRDIELLTEWRHESGYPTINLHGFYDGDGQGAYAGNIFKVRFCPVKTGQWVLVSVQSNDPNLDAQKEGFTIQCVESEHKGFWIPDKENGNRWYMRSNGEHPYIMGNTFYSFLSEYYKGEPSGGNIKNDVQENARYLNKLRFAVTGDIFPNPKVKPFIDNEGNQTDNGDYSHRPNPMWFSQRVDLAVQLSFEQDVIADIILNGPDSENARNALNPKAINGDYMPYIRYIAARYCSFPNVWICLSNEYNIYKQGNKYSDGDIVRIGLDMKNFLKYPTPLSVHGDQGDWNPKLNTGNWNDHVIIQNKLKYLNLSAEYNNLNFWIGGQKPVINDELAYEGEGDGWTEADVIEAMLGAFIGGGYASSGYKPVSKGGHYFAGNFDANEHKAIDNLLWLRQKIDENITFWKMKPVFITDATYKKNIEGPRTSIFYNAGKESRAMAWNKNQYVLTTNTKNENIMAFLPDGHWEIKQFDAISKQEKILQKAFSGVYEFNSPENRAVFFVFTKVEN